MPQGTFLTQLSNDNYDSPGTHPYDMGTSQSTLLLQKQKKMRLREYQHLVLTTHVSGLERMPATKGGS